MQNVHYEITFPSQLPVMRQVERELMGFICNKLPTINEADKAELRLVFSELIANAIIHGNNADSLKTVTLKAEISPSSVVIGKVCDEGVGFDYTNLLQSALNVCDTFQENGRGIRLVSRLTDKLIFNLSGREIIFHKRVSVDG